MVIVSSIEEMEYAGSLNESSTTLLSNLLDDFIFHFGVDFFSSASTIIILSQDNFFHVIKAPSGLQIPYEPIINLSKFIET
tara:strand:+ start:579 stop:821 length:243 start_codon:yes stop_codon:yes gene_type:complete